MQSVLNLTAKFRFVKFKSDQNIKYALHFAQIADAKTANLKSYKNILKTVFLRQIIAYFAFLTHFATNLSRV